MKVNQAAKRRRESRNGFRFYTQRDMAIIKHDQMVENARAKRGELKREGAAYIALCGCGVEGCFIHRETQGKPFNFKRGMSKGWFGDQKEFYGIVSADNPQPA